ncbi:MAG: cysteine desulfurase [Pseudomonadota bacterium]|nr:cysteine desulfurase [Pseudomonadota bacterium]|tara:strand:- start:55305 stop:56555 length:1251 start_codon:yes stop_codon:yes gene_type:complete
MEFGKEIRSEFPIFSSVGNQNLAYLDNAATTQKPKKVIDALVDFYSTSNANIGRGIYKLSMEAHQQYEDSRTTVAEFLNAKSANEIVFTKGTTEAINFIAVSYLEPNLEQGDEVLVTGMEHHSNLLPWQRACERTGAKLVVVESDEHGEVSLERMEESINSKTKFLAISHISNVLGVMNPVKEIIRKAHIHKIPVLVDGAQSVAHCKVDVQDLGADFYCLSGHKMYGPTGIGVLYINQAFQEGMLPFLVGGGVANGVEYQRITKYLPTPFCFEAGTPNLAGAVGLASAIEFLQEADMADLHKHELKLYNEMLAILEGQDNAIVYGNPANISSIVSFNIKDIHPYDIGNLLNSHNIAVRTGVHCAIPFVDSMNLLGTVRASFGLYNDLDEVHRLGDVLKQAKPGDWTRNRPNVRYLE